MMTLVSREPYNAFRGSWLVVLLDAEERALFTTDPQPAEMEADGTRRRREATVRIEGLCPRDVLAQVEHVEIWQGTTLNYRWAETAGEAVETGITFEELDERLRESMKKRPQQPAAGAN